MMQTWFQNCCGPFCLQFYLRFNWTAVLLSLQSGSWLFHWRIFHFSVLMKLLGCLLQMFKFIIHLHSEVPSYQFCHIWMNVRRETESRCQPYMPMPQPFLHQRWCHCWNHYKTVPLSWTHFSMYWIKSVPSLRRITTFMNSLLFNHPSIEKEQLCAAWCSCMWQSSTVSCWWLGATSAVRLIIESSKNQVTFEHFKSLLLPQNIQQSKILMFPSGKGSIMRNSIMRDYGKHVQY